MFQLIFRGECTPGTDSATARDNARAIFKASAAQLERMFSGNTVVIRNKLDEAQAQKYRAVMEKHGMVAHVQPMPGTRPQTTPAPAANTGGSTRAPEPDRATAETEPGGRLPVAGDKVNNILAGSSLGLDPAGVTLVEPRQSEAPVFQHLEDWELAPAGSDLGVEREKLPHSVPDVSHLKLVDDKPDNK